MAHYYLEYKGTKNKHTVLIYQNQEIKYFIKMKKLNKKLQLNKETIAKLDNMDNILGGAAVAADFGVAEPAMRADMAQVNIRIDDDLKTRAEKIFNELGLNFSTAFNLFIRQTIRQGGIPFEVTTRTDPFYSNENMKFLRKSINDAEMGKITAHELIED